MGLLQGQAQGPGRHCHPWQGEMGGWVAWPGPLMGGVWALSITGMWVLVV